MTLHAQLLHGPGPGEPGTDDDDVSEHALDASGAALTRPARHRNTARMTSRSGPDTVPTARSGDLPAPS